MWTVSSYSGDSYWWCHLPRRLKLESYKFEAYKRQTGTHLQKQNKTNKKRHLKIQKCIHYLSLLLWLRRSNLRFALAHGLREFSDYTAVKKAWQLPESVVATCSHPSGTGSSENICNKEEIGNLCQGHEPVDLLPLVRSHFLKAVHLPQTVPPDGNQVHVTQEG